MNTDNIQRLYNVLLLEGHSAQPDQIYNGFLGEQKQGRFTYTRTEAIKKAQMFGGKIEPQENLFNSKILSLERHVGTGTYVKYTMYVEFNGLMAKMCRRFSLAELKNYFDLDRKAVNSLLKGIPPEEDMP